MNKVMNILKNIISWWNKRKRDKRYEKKIKELKKRDPFIYKH